MNDLQRNKELVWGFWQALENEGVENCESIAADFMTADSDWHGPDPINELRGAAGFVSGFWKPFLNSFPDMKRASHIFMGGKSSGRVDGSGDGRMWVAGTGYFHATFSKDYLTIPATGENVRIRWGEFCCVEDGQIVETYFILDLIDLMQQAGFDVLPPSRGIDGVYPPPAAGDGVMLNAQDAATSDYTLQHIRRFIFEGPMPSASS